MEVQQRRLPQQSLMDHISVVPDPRVVRRCDHKLIDILVIVICSVLCGYEEWIEIEEFANLKIEFFKKFLELPCGIPSHDTLSRVFSLLDPSIFGKAFTDWVQEIQGILPAGSLIAIDGKFLRAALRQKGRKRSAIGIVSAWASDSGLVLAQRKTLLEKEEGEKRATEELLQMLNIEGCIVSLDANGATPRIVDQIVHQKAEYNIALKKNQKKFRKYAIKAFEHVDAQISTCTVEEKAHGRIEKRIYQQLSTQGLDLSFSKAWPELQSKWKNLRCFGRVSSERKFWTEGKWKVQNEVRYYFTSMHPDVQKWATATRSHWGIENKLHWTLDVTFEEDKNRTRTRHAAENLALVRRMVLNLLKQDIHTKKSINRKRLQCSHNEDYAFQILMQRVTH